MSAFDNQYYNITAKGKPRNTKSKKKNLKDENVRKLAVTLVTFCIQINLQTPYYGHRFYLRILKGVHTAYK